MYCTPVGKISYICKTNATICRRNVIELKENASGLLRINRA